MLRSPLSALRGLVAVELADESCPADRRLLAMIADVLLSNRKSHSLLDKVSARVTDILRAMKIDDWWDRAGEPLADMPSSAADIIGSSDGMRLSSRPPLSRIVLFAVGRDTPSILTPVKLRDSDDREPNGAAHRVAGVTTP